MPSTTRREPTSGASYRPRVFYLSYDGAQEPLGQSQILPYLQRLAGAYEITLISFEKSEPAPAVSRQMSRAGIEWRPLRYHRRPPVLSTAFDVLNGTRAMIRAARRGRPAIVHVRSYVPALIALLARARTGGKLLFDIRGFWADERVEGGLWPRGGLLYRIAKRWERRFFAEADAIVTLTEASVPQIRRWTSGRHLPIEVIPTCVEVERFVTRPSRPGGPHALWCGSISTWYRFDLAAPLASALSLPLTVLTREPHPARERLADYPATVRTVPPENVAQELFAGDVGLCLIAPSFSKTASAPTRFAEYLAAGMPVVVTAGIGDLNEIVERDRVGVVLRGEDRAALQAAAREIVAIKGDPELGGRCRRLARERFDVDEGSARYASLYSQLTATEPGPARSG